MSLSVHLRDLDPEMAAAWTTNFAGVSEVTVSLGDIFGPGHPTGPGVAIVSPANSFGYMDGGIDLVYSEHFGWELEERLRARLLSHFDGELPVGTAAIVATDNAQIPWLISAPTMRVPMNVATTANAYLAFRAALIAAREHNRTGNPPIDTIYCPGLATANGRMPPARAARQMRAAFDAIVGGAVLESGGLAGAARHHMFMVDDD